MTPTNRCCGWNEVEHFTRAILCGATYSCSSEQQKRLGNLFCLPTGALFLGSQFVRAAQTVSCAHFHVKSRTGT